jgi:hypothetical protein
MVGKRLTTVQRALKELNENLGRGWGAVGTNEAWGRGYSVVIKAKPTVSAINS